MQCRAFLFIPLSLLVASCTTPSVIAANGRRYYTIECNEFNACMQEAYDECEHGIVTWSSPLLPLKPYVTSDQRYAPGTSPITGSKAGGQLVFACRAEGELLTPSAITEQLRSTEAEYRQSQQRVQQARASFARD